MATTRPSSPDVLKTLALQNPGVFSALFAASPAAVTFKGKTYQRAAVPNDVNQRLWYLAAAAMTQPGAVARLASAKALDGFGLDGDSSEVDAARIAVSAAKSELSQARAARTAIQLELANMAANQREAEQESKDCLKNTGAWNLVSAGIPLAVCTTKWNGQIQWWKDRARALRSGTEDYAGKGLVQADAAIGAATAKVADASRELSAAQKRYDAAQRAARAAEESAAQSKARDEAERAAMQRDAANRAARASGASEAYAVGQQPDDAGGEYVEDTGDYLDAGAGPAYYDDETTEDVYGDADYLRDTQSYDEDDAVPAYVSPWGATSYYEGADGPWAYGCDDCQGACGGCKSKGYDEQDAFTFDPSIIGLILSAILSLAPAIIGFFSPPAATVQKLGEAGEQGTSGPLASPTDLASLANQVADATGITSIIDRKTADAGKAAGDRAADRYQPYAIVAVGLLAYMAFKGS